MYILWISIVAVVASALTFFSGFGLGTMLFPAFAIFFPIEVAIAATAVVHLANNLFKLAFVARHAAWSVVFRFGLPAALAAFVGSIILKVVSGLEPLVTYSLAGHACEVTLAKLVIAVLMVVFAVLEIIPSLSGLSFEKKFLPLGGVLSGLFGGLSGHQGALRTAFLIRSGLSKHAFVGTSAACAMVVDVSRLIVYGSTFFSAHMLALKEGGGGKMVLVGIVAAFIGTFIGSKLLHKVTLKKVQILVAMMLFGMAIALATGVL